MTRFLSAANGSRQPAFFAVTFTLITISIITVALRLYCRIVRIHHVGLDDYFMAAAMVVTIAMGIMNAFHVSWGTGRPGDDVPVEEILIPTFKHFYAYQLIYPTALFCVKASILALYHRIFPQKQFRVKVYFVGGLVVVYTVVVIFVNAFECGSNPSRAWQWGFPKGCNHLPTVYFSTASVNILTDVIILVLPLRSLWHLNLHKNKRLALISIFMVGGVAVVASIVRLYALQVYTVTKDNGYDAIWILFLSQIEVNTAIISASVPALRPLISKSSMAFSNSNGYENSPVGSGGRQVNPRIHDLELPSFSGRSATAKQQNHIRAGSNTSEETILRDEDCIKKTVETTVDYR